jgi:Patatin-like phospholipase
MFSRLLTRIAQLFESRYKLAGFARDPLNYSFPSNTVLADAGEALLDEQRAIKLRREILARLTTVKKLKPAPPPPIECRFPEYDEVGINRATLATVPGRTQSENDELKAREARRQASGERLEKYYDVAHKMGDLSALCLSGGGIRSAAFALGVVQGLAKRNLLQGFDYLSTVSGGGYLGSFLTAWVQRQGYAKVCDELCGKVAEDSPLQYLRSYSSYLTPDRGPFTADTLSVVAIYVRNLLLNWLIIVPLVAAALIVLKVFATVIWSLPVDRLASSPFVLGAICAAGIATMESLRQRPGWESARGTSRQFQLWVKWVLFVGGMAASITALKYLQNANQLPPSRPLPLGTLPLGAYVNGLFDNSNARVELLRPDQELVYLLMFPVLVIGAINFISWMIAYFVSRNPSELEISTRAMVRSNNAAAVANLFSFTFSGMIAGAFLGFLFYLLAQFRHFDLTAFIALCLGPPAVISAVFLGETIHVGLTSTTRWSDGEREWLATAAGYHGRFAVVWMLLVLVVFGGSYVVFYLSEQPNSFNINRLFTLGTTGGFAGLIVAWLGKASATAATLRERYNTWTNWSASILLAVATPVFLIITISFLSAGIDYLTLGQALSFSAIAGLRASYPVPDVYPLQPTELEGVLLGRFVLAFGACAFICGAASWAINTNRFSLHGLYRNRLIRAFLGGSHAINERQPNPLSQFDEHDNLNLCELWPNRYGPPPTPSNAEPLPAGAVPPQFLVINCALNVLRSDNLAWQERKALSLTCTPRAVGSAALDGGAGCYRRSREYGSLHDGISLGTAMTISGAAVSPNMGYHSSPALSVLMTFFNVRLGAWLGNPGPDGARVVMQEGPRFSALPLIQEALGLATEDKSYVYLSDGGHFENLGLYEMVRRRCRFIVLSDAGSDPGFTFEDLGNAVRKISIDLKVTIEFETLQISPRKTPPAAGGYVATAKIIYPEAGAQGRLLYIKPSYRGTEPASVRAYAEANPTFPHEPTTDQMFGESQFEAYRALGEYILQTIDGQPGWQYQSIEAFMEAVDARIADTASLEARTKAS